MRFPDRRSAGVQLGEELAARSPSNPLVLGLPRGGVPVAFEVAKALNCPLDVLVVRKLGVPWQPELAMGAVGESGVIVWNDDIVNAARVPEDQLAKVVAQETGELSRRVDAYRSNGPIDVTGATAIVVDDGIATGSTATAAMRVVRSKGAAEVWLAVPVAPRETVRAMREIADQVVVLSQPWSFGAVGLWYEDFTQTSDGEVRSLLDESRLR